MNGGFTKRRLGQIWCGAVLGSITLCWFATSQDRIVLGTVMSMIGALIGMFAVFAAIRLVAEHHSAIRESSTLAYVSGSVALVGAAVTWWGFVAESQPLALIGVAALIHGLAFLSDSFNQSVRPNKGATRSTLSVVPSNIVLVVATLAISLQEDFNGNVAIAAAVWLFAIATLKLTVVQFAVTPGDTREIRLGLSWGTAVAAIVLGAVLVAMGGRVLLVWGASLLIGGLSVLGLLVHNGVQLPKVVNNTVVDAVLPIDPETKKRRLSTSALGFVAGGITGVSSWWLLRDLAGDWSAAVAIVVVLAVVGAFFVLPGETIFGLVVLGLLIVWVSEDSDSARIEDDYASALARPDSGDAWIVSLGDSFASGEGAPKFYFGTNSPGVNGCRRAPTAYPVVVGQQLGLRTMSFACSGAISTNLSDTAQFAESPPEVAGGEPQIAALIEWLRTEPKPEVAAVLVSVGGNDSGFGDVIAACLAPGADCEEAENAFMERVADLEEDLVATYKELDAALVAAFPDARPPILVTPYPDPIGEKGIGCSLVLSVEESQFIRRFRDALNAQVQAAVLQGPEIQLVASEDSLAGHELCSEDPYVNWLRLAPTDGSLVETLNPANWVTGSLHPGVEGHCVTGLIAAEAVRVASSEVFATNTTGVGCSTPAEDPAAPRAATPTPPELCAATSNDDSETNSLMGEACTTAWVNNAFSEASRGLIIASALAVAGGMFLAGAFSAHPVTNKLPGPVAGAWIIVREIWLKYDRVAHGPMADDADSLRTFRQESPPASQ